MRKKTLFFYFSLMLMNLMFAQNYSFALQNAEDLSAIDGHKHSKEVFQAYIDMIRTNHPETEKQIVDSIYNAYVEVKRKVPDISLYEVAGELVMISNNYRELSLIQVIAFYAQHDDKVGSNKTGGFEEAWKQVILGILILGILLSLVGAYFGLNLLVIWTFVGVAILCELVLGTIGLGFVGYGFFVTFCLSVGAATWVYLKTS